MRTVTAATIAKGISRRLGRHPDARDDVDAEQRIANLAWANEVMGTVWDWAWWPDLMRVRRRRLFQDEESGNLAFVLQADNWDASENYVVGSEVWFEGVFWVALRDNTGVAPVEGEDWTEYQGYERIGTVRRVLAGIQEVESRAGWGIQLVEDMKGLAVGTDVLVEFRIPRPEITGQVIDDSISYMRGEVRYYLESGDCFESLQDGNIERDPLSLANVRWWKLVLYPAYFVRPICWLAAADGIFGDDREREGERLEAKAMETLAVLRARMIGQSGIAERANVTIFH